MQLSLPLSLLLLSSLAASTVQAQINAGNTTDLTADNADGVEVARPDWQPVPSKYEGMSTWKSCDEDDDCASDHYCVQHMWSYNGQLESGTGCWMKEVCSGSTSFDMFDGRQLQFFCSPEQSAYWVQRHDNQLVPGYLTNPPWGLTYSNRTVSDEWYSICTQDADCPGTDTAQNQKCVPVLWDVTDDGLNYANMMTCYNWDPGQDVCAAANHTDFGQENMNYDQTQFSFYNEYACAGNTSSHSDDSSADGDMDSSSSDATSVIVGMTGFFVTTIMMMV